MYGSQNFLNVSSSRNNRLSVNPYEFGRELSQEHAPYKHITDANRFHPLGGCSQYVPGVGNLYQSNQGINRSQVDIESDLKNQIRPLSDCPNEKYLPIKSQALNCSGCENCDQGLPCSCLHCKSKNETSLPDCHNQIIPVHTRLDYIKPCNLPGIYINRFEPLCTNLQNPERIHRNTYIGLGSRNYLKDKFANAIRPKTLSKKANLANHGFCQVPANSVAYSGIGSNCAPF